MGRGSAVNIGLHQNIISPARPQSFLTLEVFNLELGRVSSLCCWWKYPVTCWPKYMETAGKNIWYIEPEIKRPGGPERGTGQERLPVMPVLAMSRSPPIGQCGSNTRLWLVTPDLTQVPWCLVMPSPDHALWPEKGILGQSPSKVCKSLLGHVLNIEIHGKTRRLPIFAKYKAMAGNTFC